MNKLDLIFEKEPPEVQRKLMTLLIQYNAVMKYNKFDDKFEVDLLLPFKSQSQKEEFLSQFKQRSKKSQSSRHEETIQNISDIQLKMGESDIYHEDKNEKILELSQSHDSQNGGKGMEIDLNSVNEKDESSFTSRNIFSWEKFETNLQENLKKAIEDIRLNRFEESSEKQLAIVPEQQSKQQSQEKLIQVFQYQGGKAQNQSQQIHKLQQLNHTQEQKDAPLFVERVENQQPNLQEKNEPTEPNIEQTESKVEERVESMNSYSSIPQNKQSQISKQSQQIRIEETEDKEEEVEEEERKEVQMDSQIESQIESINYHSSFQYPEIIQEQLEDDEELFRDREKQEKEELERKIKEQKQKLRQKYKKKNSSEVSSLKNKYSDFLKKNKKQIDILYSNIRRDIVRKQGSKGKSPNSNAILILEDNIVNEGDSKEEKAFKQQIIKEYSKNIVAENGHLSSQDLIRYFRYLLKNARLLYVRNLRKK